MSLNNKWTHLSRQASSPISLLQENGCLEAKKRDIQSHIREENRNGGKTGSAKDGHHEHESD